MSHAQRQRLPLAPEPPPRSDGSRNDNPPGMGLWALWCEDLRTHEGNPFEQGFWAVAVHRFGNWRMGLPKLVRAPFTLAYLFLVKWVQVTCGISLHYNSRLGRRVHIWHHSGMILVARSIGDDCHIRHNTTLGVVRRDQPLGIPIIEERVDIGCGVAILGNVRVGHDSVIGANSVVLDDVPPWTVVAGAPARVVRELIVPAGIAGNDAGEDDPERTQRDWPTLRQDRRIATSLQKPAAPSRPPASRTR